MMSRELVAPTKQASDLRAFIGQYYKQFEALLPKHITAQRMARVAIDAAMRTPRLMQCTRESFIGALLECAALGLEPGVAGQCWLIPYKDKATFVIGYRGLAQLVLRSANISGVWAQVVREKDAFSYTEYPADMHHKRDRSSEPGALTAAYSVCRNVLGHEQFLVMERHEILKVKNASAAAKKQDSPWNTWEEQMWMKTPMKRQHKTMPMSVEAHMLYRAVALDDRADAGLPQHLEVNAERSPEEIKEASPPQPELTNEDRKALDDMKGGDKNSGEGDTDPRLTLD